MLFYMSTPLRMHYRIHVTKNNELFCHVTRPSKPSRYINYGRFESFGGKKRFYQFRLLDGFFYVHLSWNKQFQKDGGVISRTSPLFA